MRGYAVALWGEWLPRPPEDFVADRHRIVVHDGVDPGCVETTLCTDHLRLNKLYLLPGFQRQGVGAVVLQKVIAEAKHFGIPLRLSVLTTNPVQAFYQRNGLRARERNAEKIVFEADHACGGVESRKGGKASPPPSER